MFSIKRLTLATIFGFIFGIVCYGFASSGPNPISTELAWSIITSRALIGFAIGISSISIVHWSINGLIFGFIFSIPGGLGAMMSGNPDFTPTKMLVMTIVMGMIYGLLVELFTSVVFKAPLKK